MNQQNQKTLSLVLIIAVEVAIPISLMKTTGTFIPNGGSGATYKWRLKGHSLIVTYIGESAFLGSSKLRYDKKTHSFVENSISYGKLKFIKQE